METTNKSNGVMITVIVIVAIVAIVGLTMLRKGNQPPTTTPIVAEETPTAPTKVIEGNPTTQEKINAAPTVVEDTTGTSEVKVVQIEAGSFYYKPNIITVKKGQKVKVLMKSVDMMHNFNIDELNVAIPIIKSGNTGTVEFTADKLGTFEFYCSVAQHRANGQVGKLIVQ